ncbi:MAG: Rpn family recombination-promoting nuclease/putative transposase [Anaerolineae bacterium]|nr:Rpn family recombination-promoting nuclease/putative transposase [Anaerolineae bacterium]
MYDGPAELLTYFPDFRYWLVDLSQFTDQEVRGEAVLRLVLLAMKHVNDPDGIRRVREIFDLMERLWQTESTAEVVALVLRYLATGSTTMTEADLRDAMEQHWPEGVTIMATIADNWLRQGIQQGILQGRREGLIDAISLGIRLRFGKEGLPLLPEIRRIEDIAVLEAIYDSFETIESLDDLRRIYARPQP